MPYHAATAAPPETSTPSKTAKPTIVLVHGAWADSSSWTPVTLALQTAGYTVLVPPNPLRGLSNDSAYLSAFLQQATNGPVVLVGHSYGGAVISNAALTDPDVAALVYVDAFVPDVGESVGQIVAGSTSALNVPDPTTVFSFVAYPDAPAGDLDAYLKPTAFETLFAADVAKPITRALGASQKPITLSALGEPATSAAWKTLPSWYVVGTADLVLPQAKQLEMATRAKSTVTEVKASHLSMIAKPLAVTGVIVTAANSASPRR
ncbi:alpha/beta hydrolase [Cryobacterium adonitolivorans]|uniref:Alpha/beta hydrolase n=1 Tax=Cryobacterium adonitolivorans TaxID=1259189 RepID=A0A4R8W3U3_9MICO|nr:alpha/beta hydrolase [Cryobacterium adonitolivorans]